MDYNTYTARNMCKIIKERLPCRNTIEYTIEYKGKAPASPPATIQGWCSWSNCQKALQEQGCSFHMNSAPGPSELEPRCTL